MDRAPRKPLAAALLLAIALLLAPGTSRAAFGTFDAVNDCLIVAAKAQSGWFVEDNAGQRHLASR
jgi:hypothetical protein